MPECINCKKPFSTRFKDENGKHHNCQRRKYCFECSPYNSHNTSKIEVTTKDGYGNRLCKKCGKPFFSKRRNVCQSCNVSKQRQNKKEFLMSIVGYSCWKCGYGGDSRYISLLDMHHVNPSDKMFSLNATEIGKKSDTEILEESKKCVLLCSRCHREYHYTDFVSEAEIIKLHEKWKTINIGK